MKKAKVLLTVIAILAVIAGALAFTIKERSGVGSYCTTDNNNSTTACNQFMDNGKLGGLVTIFYATTTGTSCGSGISCTGEGTVTFE